MFDAVLGVYLVLEHAGLYWHDDHYISWRDGGWYSTASIGGTWVSVGSQDVPTPLVTKHAKGHQRSHGGSSGHGANASRDGGGHGANASRDGGGYGAKASREGGGHGAKASRDGGGHGAKASHGGGGGRGGSASHRGQGQEKKAGDGKARGRGYPAKRGH